MICITQSHIPASSCFQLQSLSCHWSDAAMAQSSKRQSVPAIPNEPFRGRGRVGGCGACFTEQWWKCVFAMIASVSGVSTVNGFRAERLDVCQ